MDVRMKKGDIAFVRGQVILYDELGIALRLTTGNLHVMQQAKSSKTNRRLEDTKRRKFQVSYNKTSRTFDFYTSQSHIEVKEDDLQAFMG